MAASDIGQVQGEASWVEPADAAALFSDGLLLDGMGAHPEARCAYLGLSPRLEARLQDGRFLVDGVQRAGRPLDLLRELVDSWRLPVDEVHAFTGGWMGFFGYEFSRVVEPTLPPRHATTPDMVLRLCMDAIVFDRQAHKVTVYVADEDPAVAKARLQSHLARLGDKVAPVRPAPIVGWQPSMDQATFEAAVERVKVHIAQGDLFQANIATRFQAPCNADPVDLLRALVAQNPSPYMALLRFDDHAVISSSPEQLFAIEGGRIRTRPIAGTRPRGQDAPEDQAFEDELRTDAKERAEHTMLVDLLRNDIAKVSRPGTTRVTEAMSVERYQHVMHLVSSVEGTTDAHFVDCLAALFPGGTITGAPKHRACMRIHEAEPVARGPYTGSAGFLSWSHNAHWNILIRTLVLQDGVASVHAGSGIVADSDPTREWHEADRKARSLLDVSRPQHATRLGEVTKAGRWSPPRPPRQTDARVLLVDNYDSFVHNLADYAASCGAVVQVMRNDEELDAAMASFAPTHLILGPGPGRPEDSGATLDGARLVGELPVLGVCLGHQAMAHVHGGAVRTVTPVHGMTSRIHHDDPLLAHLASPFTATRYHSLVVDVPPGWRRTAWLEDGTVMAMKHPDHPAWGVQFHPESFCTEGGLETVLRFLEAR